MLVGWLITAGGEYDTNVAMVVACIRVLRVMRIFRVTRFVRSMGTSQSYAFQRQVRGASRAAHTPTRRERGGLRRGCAGRSAPQRAANPPPPPPPPPPPARRCLCSS